MKGNYSMTIIEHKYFQPITIFTAMIISLFSFEGIKIFSLAVLIVTFSSATIMAINIYKDDKRDKAKNSLIEFQTVDKLKICPFRPSARSGEIS